MKAALTLDNLLRYAFSGVVFLLSYFWPADFTPAIDGRTVGLSGIALVVGAFVYSVHRAVIHPFLNRLVLLVLLGPVDRVFGTGNRVWTWSLPRLNTVEQHWQLRRFIIRKDRRRGAWHFRWASHTHLLYTFAEAYWLACALVPPTRNISLPRSGVLAFLSSLVFVVGFIDDLRGASAELGPKQN